MMMQYGSQNFLDSDNGYLQGNKIYYRMMSQPATSIGGGCERERASERIDPLRMLNLEKFILDWIKNKTDSRRSLFFWMLRVAQLSMHTPHGTCLGR